MKISLLTSVLSGLALAFVVVAPAHAVDDNGNGFVNVPPPPPSAAKSEADKELEAKYPKGSVNVRDIPESALVPLVPPSKDDQR